MVLGFPRSNRLRVLAYHGAVQAVPFERQMEHLARRHALVSVARVLDTFEGGHALPARALLLVFDEPRSFAQVAWPILRRHASAAVLFLAEGESTAQAGLEVLVRQGLALGVRLGEAARAGSSSAAQACARIARALRVLEHDHSGLARLLAYPVGRPSETLVEAARAAGVELGFTSLAGANDLGRIDRLRLRSLAIEAQSPLDELRAGLGAGAQSTTPAERRAGRRLRVRRARLRAVYRPLDALLTAGVPPSAGFRGALRGLARRRCSGYERLRSLVQLVTLPLPALERALRRVLLDRSRLPFGAAGLELAGHGTAATVFRLEATPALPEHVLKLYRWTLGLPSPLLAQMARRHRARYLQLRGWFGEHVPRTHYLVLHGPLCALPVVACLQERVEHATDFLALSDAELVRLVRARPALGAEFVALARRVLALHALGLFPDLLGPGNLLLVERGDGPHLWLIDFGLFDLRSGSAHLPSAALEAMVQRLAGLLRQLEHLL